MDIPTTGWTKTGNTYSQSFTVKGILEEDNPIVGLVLSSTNEEQVSLEQLAYSCIGCITTKENQITAYCYGISPSIPFTININCTGT